MKPEKIAKQYAAHTNFWIREIKQFSVDALARSAPGEWNAAQVADHICRTTHKCLDNAEDCINGNGEKGHAAFGPAIFSLMGSFPPVKLRIKNPPEAAGTIYAPETISAEQAEEGLKKAEARMWQVLAKLRHADPDMRIKHWAGGWFNAAQWFHNAEMHIKHHKRQLKRIKKQQINL